MSRRVELTAETGLLAVCIVLAVGLVLTAGLNDRAARRAARDVLFSQGTQLASSYMASVRVSRDMLDEAHMQQLAQELTADGLELVLMDLDGRVRVAARDGQPLAIPGGRASLPARILVELRLRGQALGPISEEDGQLVCYYPFHPRPRGPGWRRGLPGRWRRDGKVVGPEADPPPFALAPPSKGVPPPAWVLPPGAPPPNLRILRLTLPLSRASGLMGPARTALWLSFPVAAVLMVLGGLLHRAASRERRERKEQSRRRALLALGEMGAVLAHEIRTPLASIKGNAQLLAEEHRADDRALAIVAESSRLERLVNGLLDYARPSEPRWDSVVAADLLERAAEIISHRAAIKQVNLVLDRGPEGLTLRADRDQLLQVLVNLLSNAVEACTEPSAQGRTVTVSVERRGNRAMFSILDQGPGLRGARLEELARPFHSTRAGGTGLGLSVASRIVEQHRGELRLEDRREGGAMARVSLPVDGN